MLRRLIARTFWAFSRWKLVTEPAPDRPTILIGAPHTSNWDFVYMLGIAWQLGIDLRWLGKHTLFKKPFTHVSQIFNSQSNVSIFRIVRFKLTFFESY